MRLVLCILLVFLTAARVAFEPSNRAEYVCGVVSTTALVTTAVVLALPLLFASALPGAALADGSPDHEYAGACRNELVASAQQSVPVAFIAASAFCAIVFIHDTLACTVSLFTCYALGLVVSILRTHQLGTDQRQGVAFQPNNPMLGAGAAQPAFSDSCDKRQQLDQDARYEKV